MARPDLQWLLDEHVARVPGVTQAIVLSADGLLLAQSDGLHRDSSEHLAAVASAFQSLARSATERFDPGGRARQTVVEADDLTLLITMAGAGACLAVLARADAEIGTVAYEAGLLVRRVGKALSAAPRAGDTPGARPLP